MIGRNNIHRKRTNTEPQANAMRDPLGRSLGAAPRANPTAKRGSNTNGNKKTSV
jgi:hypothetical protein